MPAGYATDAALGVLFVKCWGQLTERDIGALREAILHDGRVGADWTTLTDMRSVESFDVIGSAFIRSYSTVLERSAPRAVLVSGAAAYGLARMYGASAVDESTFRIFEDWPTAIEWLDLPPETSMPELHATFGDEAEDAGR